MYIGEVGFVHVYVRCFYGHKYCSGQKWLFFKGTPNNDIYVKVHP